MVQTIKLTEHKPLKLTEVAWVQKHYKQNNINNIYKK